MGHIRTECTKERDGETLLGKVVRAKMDRLPRPWYAANSIGVILGVRNSLVSTYPESPKENDEE